MELHICNEKDMEKYSVKYRCFSGIRRLYETYDSEKLFVVSQEPIVFEDLIKFISKKYRMHIFNFKLGETLDAAISLLRNPFFDELCDYVEANIKILKKKFLKFLKKEIFSYFVTEKYILVSQWIANTGLGSEVSNPNVTPKSKKMIELINEYI